MNLHIDTTHGWTAMPTSDNAATVRTALMVQPAQPRRTASVVGWSASALAHALAFALLASHFGEKQTREPAAVPPIAIEVVTPAQSAPAVARPVAPPRQSTPSPSAPPHPRSAAPPASPPRSAQHAPPAAATRQDASPAAPRAQDAASAQPAAAASAAPSAAPSAASAALTPETPELPVTPPIGNAAYLHNPPPRYPRSAQEEGWEGRVVLRVHVDAGGHPVEVRLHASSSHEALDKAALAAVRQWSFVPAKRGSTPTDGWVDVPLDFRLN